MTVLGLGAGNFAAAASFSDAGEILGEVLRRTEESFVSAGDELVSSVDLLRLLRDQFDRLNHVFGQENGDRLRRLIGGARDNVDELQAGFDGFFTTSALLRQAVRGVKVEVADLDRVVRTIANVSINARIQGNGLVPPRPQVSAFIDRLALMAGEGEAIIAGMREAMGVIGAEMVAMEEMMQDLRDEIGHRVLPMLGRFGRVARGVLDRQGALAATNAELAEKMAHIDREVSRLVMGLQSGDATRQRLERVRDILSNAGGGGALEAMLLDLAAGLARSAVDAAGAEIAVSVKATETVRAEADRTVQQARDFYLDREAQGGSVEEFGISVAKVRVKLEDIRNRTLELRTRLWAILEHEAELRQIGHQVRLSGLNAVLICAKLGEEGRALRELAQWLRTLTDESDSIVANMQTVLGDTAEAADALGGPNAEALDAALKQFFEDASALGGVMQEITQGRADAARVFDDAGRTLPLRLGHAAQQLMRFQALTREMAFFDAALLARRAVLGAASHPDAETLERLAELRKRYTMQSEREVHDAIVGGPLAAAVAGLARPETVEDAPAAESDDLDDILF